MRITKLIAENFKRLRAIEITPQGNTVLITGKNGAGKSSVLDAITAAFCGKKFMPDKPIRDGEDHAEVVVTTDNYIIKRTFTPEGGGTLSVTNAEGMKASSPQALLDKIVGEIAFDPMSFIELGQSETGKREQRSMLMKLTGLDFSDIDKGLADIKQKRSNVRSQKELAEHEAETIAVEVGTPDVEVSMSQLNADMQNAIEMNNKLADVKREIESCQTFIAQADWTLKQQDQLIADMKKSLASAEQSRAKMVADRAIIETKMQHAAGRLEPRIATEIIQQAIDDLEKTNAAVRAKQRKAVLQKQVTAATIEFAKLGKDAKVLEEQKAKRLAEAKMPIPGLSVDENGVIYGKIPLSQVNESEQLKIGVAMGMALNPKLKVIRMKGNDLDDANLAAVSQMVAEKGYQVWIERIEGEAGFVIEDGSVKSS